MKKNKIVHFWLNYLCYLETKSIPLTALKSCSNNFLLYIMFEWIITLINIYNVWRQIEVLFLEKWVGKIMITKEDGVACQVSACNGGPFCFVVSACAAIKNERSKLWHHSRKLLQITGYWLKRLFKSSLYLSWQWDSLEIRHIFHSCWQVITQEKRFLCTHFRSKGENRLCKVDQTQNSSFGCSAHGIFNTIFF